MQPTVLVACDSAIGDGSPVAFARTIAALLGARVTLVSVRESDGLAGTEADDASAVVGADWRVERASSPAAGLQRLIAAEQPRLTVLGSAHDAGHGRMRVGETAERVLQGAARAVAVVPRGHGERALGVIGVGLLPTPDSLRALRAAAWLARAARVPLLVLTVLRRSPDAAGAAALAARLSPATAAHTRGPAAVVLREAIVAAAREGGDGAQEFATDAPADPLVVEPLILVGDPADALLRATGRLGLLVLGSRAYGPPGVVLPGGVARRVLADARCPVLLVPRAEVSAPMAVPA